MRKSGASSRAATEWSCPISRSSSVIVRSSAPPSSGILPEAEARELHALLASTARRWSLMRLDDEVVSRVRRPFALEPLRALDALHLASALIAREGAGPFVHAGLEVAPA